VCAKHQKQWLVRHGQRELLLAVDVPVEDGVSSRLEVRQRRVRQKPGVPERLEGRVARAP
jgi:hypothetical protein